MIEHSREKLLFHGFFANCEYFTIENFIAYNLDKIIILHEILQHFILATYICNYNYDGYMEHGIIYILLYSDCSLRQ